MEIESKPTPEEPCAELPLRKPKRIAIVTRRFWPVSGSTEFAVGQIAGEIQKAGHTVEIFTVCWQKDWPKNLHFGEVPVRRLPKPASGPWRSLQSSRSMSRHIVDFQPDGILAFGADDQTWLAAKVFSDQVPFAVRMDNRSLDLDSSRSSNASRQSQVFEMASSLLADCQQTAEELARRNPDCSSKIQIVPDLIDSAAPDERTRAKQNAARNALSDAHPVLSIETDQPLIVCAAPLDHDGGVLDLVRAWPSVLQRLPNARLWILGDGSSGQVIWDEINKLDLVYSVIMPGFFDDLSEVLLAADLYVHPLRHSGYDSRLAEALLAGICCVASPANPHEGLVQHDQTGLIADPQQTLEFSDVLIDALLQPTLRQRLGQAGLRANQPKFDSQKILNRYLNSFYTGAEQPPSTLD